MAHVFFWVGSIRSISHGKKNTRRNTRRTRKDQKKKGREKFRYFFGVSRIEVCRQTFIDTLDITHGLLQSVDKRKTETGEVAESKRGKGE